VAWQRRVIAVVIIQRNIRKYLDRMRILLFLYDRALKALVKIQALARGWRVRRHLTEDIAGVRMNVSPLTLALHSFFPAQAAL
jgi:hypothetical protein